MLRRATAESSPSKEKPLNLPTLKVLLGSMPVSVWTVLSTTERIALSSNSTIQEFGTDAAVVTFLATMVGRASTEGSAARRMAVKDRISEVLDELGKCLERVLMFWIPAESAPRTYNDPSSPFCTRRCDGRHAVHREQAFSLSASKHGKPHDYWCTP